MTAAMTDYVCEAPAFRLRDITDEANLHPVGTAVEELLQLRHDIDDHALAVKLLRGIRPDLTPAQIEGLISEQLHRADQVHDAELNGSRGDFERAVDRYEFALRTFSDRGGR